MRMDSNDIQRLREEENAIAMDSRLCRISRCAVDALL